MFFFFWGEIRFVRGSWIGGQCCRCNCHLDWPKWNLSLCFFAHFGFQPWHLAPGNCCMKRFNWKREVTQDTSAIFSACGQSIYDTVVIQHTRKWGFLETSIPRVDAIETNVNMNLHATTTELILLSWCWVRRFVRLVGRLRIESHIVIDLLPW